jgi:tartronate-semialdehyde synthase
MCGGDNAASRDFTARLERVTNISMGTEIDNLVEFEEVLDLPLEDAPEKSTTPGTWLPA